MNCFNHPDVPAVGVCKTCQKGLCIVCAYDLGNGIACKNHRDEVEARNSITDVHRVAAVFAILGCIMMLSGSFMDFSTDEKEQILQLLGIVMAFLGAFFFWLGNKIRKTKSK
ncbi:MAG: hypothetical protein HY867_09655 [Chloroflexi bacterium]|nr:hypothetical protein [Chloroflexota bacterium]